MDDFAFASSDSDGGEYGAIVSEVEVEVEVEVVPQEAARDLETGIANASIDVSRAGRMQMMRIIMAELFVSGMFDSAAGT